MNGSELAQDNVKYTDVVNIIQISWLHKVRNSLTEYISRICDNSVTTQNA